MRLPHVVLRVHVDFPHAFHTRFPIDPTLGASAFAKRFEFTRQCVKLLCFRAENPHGLWHIIRPHTLQLLEFTIFASDGTHSPPPPVVSGVRVFWFYLGNRRFTDCYAVLPTGMCAPPYSALSTDQ